MSAREWVKASSKWCDRYLAEAHLMERRAYPEGIIPDLPAYRVTAKKCDLAVNCNLAGISCRWSFTNPGTEPFTQ